MVAAEGLTARSDRLLLRLAIDYSGRDAILAAALAGPTSRREFGWNLDRAIHARTPVPDIDLLVRTGGERRLSDFMLWESAYAELLFTDTPWPAFTVRDLQSAVSEFHRRDRRFGGLPAAKTAPRAGDRGRKMVRTPAEAGLGGLSGVVTAHAPRR
jgi:undecaprenyl diphosphate synthase